VVVCVLYIVILLAVKDFSACVLAVLYLWAKQITIQLYLVPRLRSAPICTRQQHFHGTVLQHYPFLKVQDILANEMPS